MINKKHTAVEWFSNQAYELFEQYSEMKFDRITLNKLMLEATELAIEIEKQQIINAWICDDNVLQRIEAEKYYKKTYDN